MPRFAKVESGEVVNVVVAASKEWCEANLGGTWVETARGDSFVQYAGIGMTYDPAHPKQFAPPWSTLGQTQQVGDEGSYWLYNTQGQYVSHAGKIWTNLLPTGTPNVWEPGVANWRQYQLGTNYTVWVQPTGAFDAYPAGFRVEHNGKEWESDLDANVWEPGIANWTDLNPPPPTEEWAVGTAYAVGDEVTYLGNLYRCLQAHTAIAGWTPVAVPALWEAL
jgi:hypothetical protein